MTNSKPLWARARNGLMSLCLLLSLTACGTLRGVPVAMLPPPELYEAPVDVPEPPQGALRNAELSKYALSLIEALGLANADRAALRAWVQQLKKEK